MRGAVPILLLLACGSAAHAQEPSPATPAPPVAQADGVAQADSVAGDDAQKLREEIERTRREAEEQRREQEKRIQALEEKLKSLEQKLQSAPSTPAGNPNAAKTPNPVTTRPGFKAKLYGFARGDMDVDSGPFNSHPHLPFWVLSPDDPRAKHNHGDVTIHPRLSRVGLDTEAPPVKLLGDARVTSKLEVDFFNFAPGATTATSNSRQFLRIRHAYAQIEKDDFQFLFGQTWDLISPLYPSVNYDVLMWNAGNLGDRRPQFRATWQTKVGKGHASVAAAVLDSGAIDLANRDANLQIDGEQSARPMLQGRVAITQPSWVPGQNWELGFWGHNAGYHWNPANAVNHRNSFEGNSLGLDLRLPIQKRWLLQGEAFTGRALSDVRGGVGQDINPLTGKTIASQGIWGEALYQATSFYTVGLGFSIDNPRNSDVPAFGTTTGFEKDPTLVGRTENRTLYISNHFNLGSGLMIGADWMVFRTDFRGLRSGSSNRWNLWVQQSF